MEIKVMDERFILGTEDGGVSFDIFERDGDQNYLVCTTREEKYAQFITAALNQCQSFWHLLQNYKSHDFVD